MLQSIFSNLIPPGHIVQNLSISFYKILPTGKDWTNIQKTIPIDIHQDKRCGRLKIDELAKASSQLNKYITDSCVTLSAIEMMEMRQVLYGFRASVSM